MPPAKPRMERGRVWEQEAGRTTTRVMAKSEHETTKRKRKKKRKRKEKIERPIGYCTHFWLKRVLPSAKEECEIGGGRRRSRNQRKRDEKGNISRAANERILCGTRTQPIRSEGFRSLSRNLRPLLVFLLFLFSLLSLLLLLLLLLLHPPPHCPPLVIFYFYFYFFFLFFSVFSVFFFLFGLEIGQFSHMAESSESPHPLPFLIAKLGEDLMESPCSTLLQLPPSFTPSPFFDRFR